VEPRKGLFPARIERNQTMSRTSGMKWILLLVGSTVVALQLGQCITQLLLQTYILNQVT
jgi:hypothetical protein